MITETFSPKYHRLTPEKKLNFIGAVERYFDSYTKGFEDETINTYIRDYNERIFPVISPSKSIEDYDEEYIEKILETIKKQKTYSDGTIISRYRHLLVDPFDAYYKEIKQVEASPFWGAAYKFNSKDECVDATLLKIPKSLTFEEEQRAAKMLSDYKTAEGARIGLFIMFNCGVRNNEAAGFNFGDLIELSEHPGYYTLRMTRTSQRGSNIRKAGGKTTNAPRRIPITTTFAGFLLDRMAFIQEHINFPFIDSSGNQFDSILEFPIACRKEDYSVACSASDLTKHGRFFLHNELNLQENKISGLSYMIQQPKYEIAEKDPTTYLFRRNLATRLYMLGFPIEWCQYYLGHLIDNDSIKRWDFNDEGFLFEMIKLLERHPINNTVNSNNIELYCEENIRHLLLVENREINDPIKIRINGANVERITTTKALHDLPGEIDITRFFPTKND